MRMTIKIKLILKSDKTVYKARKIIIHPEPDEVEYSNVESFTIAESINMEIYGEKQLNITLLPIGNETNKGIKHMIKR